VIRERATLPRKERLRRRADFQRLYRAGSKIETSGVLLFWECCDPGRRVGVSASRRIGGSVERNRARRRLREAYRLNKRVLPDGLDILLVARPGLLREPFERLCQTVAAGFAKMGARRSAGKTVGSTS
jgi:ribonuclease P protein component